MDKDTASTITDMGDQASKLDEDEDVESGQVHVRDRINAYEAKFSEHTPLLKKNTESDLWSDASSEEVTFASQDQTTLFTSLDNDNEEEPQTTKVKPQVKKRSPPKSKDNTYMGPFAAISPAENLTFVLTEEFKENQANIRILNTFDQPVAYKVKTTSPDGYRVRPSMAVIQPGSVAEVSVFLQPAHRPNASRDKFLIMCLQVGDKIPQANKLGDMWRAPKDPTKYMEHRLWCTISTGSPDEDLSEGGQLKQTLEQMSKQLETLLERNQKLERRLSCLFATQLIIALIFITLVVVIVVYLFHGNNISENHYTSRSTYSTCS